MEVINRYKNKKRKENGWKKIKKQTKKEKQLGKKNKREKSRCNVTQRCDLDRLDHFH